MHLPLSLTPLETYYWYDDRDPYPTTFPFDMRFSGVLRREPLERALQVAVGRHPMLRAWVDDAGRVVVPASFRTTTLLALAGSFAHLVVGAALGALYAACQQRTSTSGIFAAGTFYGFIIWLAGYLVLVRLFQSGPGSLPTWPGLMMTLA